MVCRAMPTRVRTCYSQVRYAGSISRASSSSSPSASRTGVLEVRDFDEYGFIYLIGGRVEGISLPITDEKLGTRLVKAGLLDEQQLSEVLMEDTLLTKEEKKAKPLGQRLIDKGYIDRRPTCATSWPGRPPTRSSPSRTGRTASSSTTEPEKMPEFRVRISGNVQAFLLDAYRRIDEGEQLKTKKTVIDNEVCFHCPVEAEVHARDQGQVSQGGRLPVA